MVIRDIAYYIVFLFFLFMMGRLVFDWIQVFARDWKPRGVALVVAEAIYTVTDPPLRAVRKIIPPLRLGSIQLDLAFLVIILACSLLMAILQ